MRWETIDKWASTAEQVMGSREAMFLARRRELSREEEIAWLRRLSYLFYKAQQGCLPLTNQRRVLYRKARVYYLATETLTFDNTFRRLRINWDEHVLFGNLHFHP
jgi:hypothetical protein